MTQVVRPDSSRSVTSGSKRRTNAAALASQWAAKRQAKIEAALAKKQAREDGEVTEHHTFRPATGRAPVDGRRVAGLTSEPLSQSRRSSTAAEPLSQSRRSSSAVEPEPLRSQNLAYRDTFPDLDARESEGRTLMRSSHERGPVREGSFSSSTDPRRLERTPADSAAAAAIAMATGCCARGADDPWLHADFQGPDSNATTTTGGSMGMATGLSAMLGSAGSLSLGSSHPLDYVSCGTASGRDGLLDSSSQHLAFAESLQRSGPECQESLLPNAAGLLRSDSFGCEASLPSSPVAHPPCEDGHWLSGHADSSLEHIAASFGPVTEHLSSGTGPVASWSGASVFLATPSSSSISLDCYTEHLQYLDGSVPATVAVATASCPELLGSREMSSRGAGRERGSLPGFEGREPRNGHDDASECLVATMEQLREEHLPDDGDSERAPPSQDSLSAASFSWWDVAADAREQQLQSGGSLGSNFGASTRTSALILAGGDAGSSSSRSGALWRQEAVLDGMRLGECLARDGDGWISMQDLHPLMYGTGHEDFLFWLTHCSCFARAGAQELLMDDLGTALADFYLRNSQEGADLPMSMPPGSALIVCEKAQEAPTLPSLESLEAIHHNLEHHVHERAAAVHGRSVTDHMHRDHKATDHAHSGCEAEDLAPAPSTPRADFSNFRRPQLCAGTAMGTEREDTSNMPPSALPAGPGFPHLSDPRVTGCDTAVRVPWREAPLRREEIAARHAQQSLCQELPMCSLEAQPSEDVPLFCNARGTGVHSASPSLGGPLVSAVPTPPQQRESVQPPEADRQCWRRAQAESLERKCQELEQQLVAAKEAEVVLRQELLSPRHTTCLYQEAFSQGEDCEMVKIWPRAAEVHALALEVSAHTAAHDAFGLPGLPGLSASSRRAGGSRCLLSPVAEEREESPPNSARQYAAETNDECELSMPFETQETVRQWSPRQQNASASTEEVEDAAQEAHDAHLAEMQSRVAEAELEGDTMEMQKLVDMCDRLRREGVSLPKEEIDGLSTLVSRLSQLMERRHLSGQGQAEAAAPAPLSSFIHQPSTQEKQAMGTAREMLAGVLKSTEDACGVRGLEQRPAVPKLRNMPSTWAASVPSTDVDQDSVSPRDAPVLR